MAAQLGVTFCDISCSWQRAPTRLMVGQYHTSRAMWLVQIGTLCIVVRGGTLIERWIDIGL